MDTYKLMQQAHFNRLNLMSDHLCDITSALKNESEIKQTELYQYVLHDKFTITLIDLSEGRYTFYSSAYKQLFPVPSIDTSVPDNWNQTYHLIHPDDRYFADNTDLMGYRYLMALPPEKRRLFEMIYMIRYKDGYGHYQACLNRVYVWMNDTKNNPWLLICKTKQLPFCNTENFQPYRQFCLFSEDTQQAVKHFEAYNTLEIKNVKLKILEIRAQQKTIEETAALLFLSDKTIRNYDTEIIRRLNVFNMADAIYLATLLRII